MTAGVLLLQGAAVAASLLGYLLLARDALFGSGQEISALDGLALASVAALYGWWLAPVAAATSGIRGAMLALVILDAAWALLGQGIGGYAFCAIPCPVAFPFSDLARLGSLVFGAWAAWAAWRGYRTMAGPTQLAPPVTAVVLVVISFALQAATTP